MIAAASAGRFQAAWYLSLTLFGIAALSAIAVVLAQSSVRAMWRDGARALALLVTVVVALFTMFGLTLLLATSIGLLERAFGS